MNKDLVRYRLDRAREAADDAGFLLSDNRLRGRTRRFQFVIIPVSDFIV
jgi:hypothetical protein